MKVGSCERDEKRLSEGRSVAEESACCVSVRARQREEVGRAKGHRCVGLMTNPEKALVASFIVLLETDQLR